MIIIFGGYPFVVRRVGQQPSEGGSFRNGGSTPPLGALLIMLNFFIMHLPAVRSAGDPVGMVDTS